MNRRKLLAFAALAPTFAMTGAVNAAPRRVYATRRTFNGAVEPGHLMLIGPFSSIGFDCQATSYASMRVLKAPSKGRVSYVMGRGDAGFEKGARLEKCNFYPDRGPMVQFTPRPGAKGADHFRFLLSFADGERRTVDVNVEIR
jgi:hypothetical protein